jgi:rare lipoprotein A
MMLASKLIVLSSIALFLGGCSSFDTRSSRSADPGLPPSKGGGYYKDDGPGANPPANLAAIPDAVPRAEPPHRFANDPYEVMGKTYVPIPVGQAYKGRGGASWYGRRYHGKSTSTGEIYDMYAMTAAHATLPLPSYVRVTNPANGRSVVVRVNDRGPFHDGRIIDLSYTAAWKLDLIKGVAPVEVELLQPDAQAIPANLARAGTPPTNPSSPVITVAELPPPTSTQALPLGLYLQVGAFAQDGAAEDLARRVRQSLGENQAGVVRHQSSGLIKVQVGPFDNVVQADQVAQALEQRLGIRPYRVTR